MSHAVGHAVGQRQMRSRNPYFAKALDAIMFSP